MEGAPKMARASAYAALLMALSRFPRACAWRAHGEKNRCVATQAQWEICCKSLSVSACLSEESDPTSQRKLGYLGMLVVSMVSNTASRSIACHIRRPNFIRAAREACWESTTLSACQTSALTSTTCSRD
eukprot:353522-Chlamydomonas_euryale.AAC.12